MTNADQAAALISALSNFDVYAATFETERDSVGVNVWAARTDRYPTQSVYIDGDGYTWGPSFEFNAKPGTTVDEVAVQIMWSSSQPAPFTPSAKTLAEYGKRPVPPGWDWPEVKGIFVGGCIARGIGSSFRAQAHAHSNRRDEHPGWICVRSHRRLFGQTRLADGTWKPTDRPSRIMLHEYAHILTGQGHTDAWRAKMRELGQPIPKHYKKKRRS